MAEQRETATRYNVNEIGGHLGRAQVTASAPLSPQAYATSSYELLDASQRIGKPSFHPTDSNSARRNKLSPSQSNVGADGYLYRPVRTYLTMTLSKVMQSLYRTFHTAEPR